MSSQESSNGTIYQCTTKVVDIEIFCPQFLKSVRVHFAPVKIAINELLGQDL